MPLLCHVPHSQQLQILDFLHRRVDDVRFFQTSGNFYGTTTWGGVNGVGTVFELTSSGKEKVLYSFAGARGGPNPYPYDGVVRDSHGNLDGVTWPGGSSGCGGWGCGVVYEITAAGEEKTLYRFTGGVDGGNPSSAAISLATTATTTVVGRYLELLRNRPIRMKDETMPLHELLHATRPGTPQKAQNRTSVIPNSTTTYARLSPLPIGCSTN